MRASLEWSRQERGCIACALGVLVIGKNLASLESDEVALRTRPCIGEAGMQRSEWTLSDRNLEARGVPLSGDAVQQLSECFSQAGPSHHATSALSASITDDLLRPLRDIPRALAPSYSLS